MYDYEMVETLKHEKDSEILRLLNQIATDMIRKSKSRFQRMCFMTFCNNYK